MPYIFLKKYEEVYGSDKTRDQDGRTIQGMSSLCLLASIQVKQEIILHARLDLGAGKEDRSQANALRRVFRIYAPWRSGKMSYT